jgi:VCBS repeat-containing protein
LANDTAGDGGAMTAEIVSSTTSGSLTLEPDGSFTYVPNADFFGTDTFTYIATDGVNDSAPATVTINVTPENDAPVAEPDSYWDARGRRVVRPLGQR